MLTFTITGWDIDSLAPQSVALSATGIPQGASFNIAYNGGQFTWTPAYGAAKNSPYNVTFNVTSARTNL